MWGASSRTIRELRLAQVSRLGSPECWLRQLSSKLIANLLGKLLMRHQRQLEENECHAHCELEEPGIHLEHVMQFQNVVLLVLLIKRTSRKI